VSAAREFKDVVDELSAAAEALRGRDKDRVKQLREELAAIDKERQQTEERTARTRLGVGLRWDQIVDVLWAESWMTLRPYPRPNRGAEPERLDALDAAVERTADGVLGAVRRRFGLGLR
jgi:hypothetical protein